MTQAPVRRRRAVRVYRPEDDGHRGRPPAASRPPHDVGSVVQLVTAIGSPIALGTALLFYFGERRSAAEARALGFDVSVLGMSRRTSCSEASRCSSSRWRSCSWPAWARSGRMPGCCAS